MVDPGLALSFALASLVFVVIPGRAAAPVQMLLLGLISVTIAIASDSTYGVLAGTARELVLEPAAPARAPRWRRGAVMIALGLRLARD